MKQWISELKPFKAFIRPFLHHPLDHDLMEFKYGLWSGVSSLFDEDERQLGEGNVRPVIFNHDIPTEVHACKYSGARNNKSINVSSLRATMSQFYEATAITVAIRDYHMAQINKPITDSPGIWDLYAISRASLALIAYRYRSTNRSSNERVPNDLGSQYKMVTGIYMIGREMMDAAHPAIQKNTPLSAQALYDYADNHNLFESETGMVCAGSTSKIIEFLDFTNQGYTHPESVKLKVKTTEYPLDLLGKFTCDLKGWYRYALLNIEMDGYIKMEVLKRAIKANPSTQERLQPVLDICRSQHSYWAQLLGDYAPLDTLSFEKGALERQNTILALLKKPTIKNIPNKALHSRLHVKNQTGIIE